MSAHAVFLISTVFKISSHKRYIPYMKLHMRNLLECLIHEDNVAKDMKEKFTNILVNITEV